MRTKKGSSLFKAAAAAAKENLLKKEASFLTNPDLAREGEEGAFSLKCPW